VNKSKKHLYNFTTSVNLGYGPHLNRHCFDADPDRHLFDADPDLLYIFMELDPDRHLFDADPDLHK
jgi:hypothetical protein